LRPALPLLASALLLAACAKEQPLTLPAEPVDRAASCGIVAAAEARLATADFKAPLALEAQGRILHYAMLAAVEGDGFDAQRASAVSKRMTELEAGITKGKWQDLLPACTAAYPAADKTEIVLPAGRTDALLQCDEVANFLLDALARQNAAHADRLAGYRQLKQKLDRDLVAGLRARAGASPAAQQKERRKALAAATKLGSPVAVLDRCEKRFG
jgi:hypothetical protein